MKNCILCKNKTTEEKVKVANRMIKFILVCIVMLVMVFVYDMVSAALSNDYMPNHFGQMCSTLGILVCSLSLNIKNKKQLEAELKA